MNEPRLGWPWCGDIPTGGEIRGDVIATVHHDDGRVTVAWDRPDATCTIVGRDVLDGIVEERNRLIRANRKHEQRAELQRQRVAELEAERDDLAATDDVLRTDLALRDAEVAGLTAEMERLRIVETASIGAHALLADAEEEVERLRGLLADDEAHVTRLADALITARDERHHRGDYDDEETQDVRTILRELRREVGPS